ncbi:hypothetical protein TREES_T100014920 [Tupaia chinensis]|uniref:Uncharacterized protein n=1 Tax=Tupaia chinensis TaxID=246437 RepID=L9KT57_TUPCH|nr:hypothetical protein TREES_T100014920 [Tupaia chinensis]
MSRVTQPGLSGGWEVRDPVFRKKIQKRFQERTEIPTTGPAQTSLSQPEEPQLTLGPGSHQKHGRPEHVLEESASVEKPCFFLPDHTIFHGAAATTSSPNWVYHPKGKRHFLARSSNKVPEEWPDRSGPGRMPPQNESLCTGQPKAIVSPGTLRGEGDGRWEGEIRILSWVCNQEARWDYDVTFAFLQDTGGEKTTEGKLSFA